MVLPSFTELDVLHGEDERVVRASGVSDGRVVEDRLLIPFFIGTAETS